MSCHRTEPAKNYKADERDGAEPTNHGALSYSPGAFAIGVTRTCGAKPVPSPVAMPPAQASRCLQRRFRAARPPVAGTAPSARSSALYEQRKFVVSGTHGAFDHDILQLFPLDIHGKDVLAPATPERIWAVTPEKRPIVPGLRRHDRAGSWRRFDNWNHIDLKHRNFWLSAFSDQHRVRTQ